MRPLAAVMAATLATSACDLPTSADEARAHLGRNQEERIIPIQLPLPEISVTLADQLGALSGIVDTTDLSFRVDPDTFAVSLDSLLTLDPIDPDPVIQGYDLAIDDFIRQIDVTVPPVPVDLPGLESPVQLPLAPTGPFEFEPIPVTLSGFATATFAAGSEFQVILTTDATASVTNVVATIEDGGVAVASSAPVSIDPGATATLAIPLGGLEISSSIDIVLSLEAGSGDGTADELTMTTRFANASVTAATGVDAGLVTPVMVNEVVTLDQVGPDFSQATMASGTVAVTDFSSGSLVFDPTFDGDLTGLQIGGTGADELTVLGEVGAPTGATTVDIASSAAIEVTFTDLNVASVTLNSLSMDLAQDVPVDAGATLDNLAQVTIHTGELRVDVVNRLGVTGTVTLTLNGVTDVTGAVISQTFTLQASPDGSPVTTVVLLDLADAVLDPAALAPAVTGTIGGTDVTVTAEAAAEAVAVDPYLEIQAREVVLSGAPDMSLELDERVPVATGDIDLGELGDLIDKIHFNDVAFTVTVDNATGIDVAVAGFRMTLLDALGEPVTDAAGDTARVELTGGGAALTVPGQTSTVIDAAAEAFVNALLRKVAAGEDVDVAASGVVGPAGETGTLALGDEIAVVYEIRLGPDISIDPTGISFDQVVNEAIDLDSIQAEFMADLSEDLVSAGVEFEVVNGMPFGLSVAMVMAPTPFDTTGFDPFAAARKIELPAFSIAPAAVDAEGRVTGPTVSTPEATVDAASLDVLREGTLSMGLRADITGPPGDRAQLSPTDSLVLRPLLKIEIRVGGNGGTQ